MNFPDELRIDLSERFPRLERAPIVEAVIHWHARAERELHPEQFRQQLSDRLPDYPDCKQVRKLHFETKLEPNGSATQLHRETWGGLRLTSADKSYVAQFSRDGLVFSRLKPYENWDAFEKEARRLWRLWVELAEPAAVQRLGVRFINRIALMTIEALNKFLQRPPKRFESFGMPTVSYLYQTTHNVPGYPYRINVIDTVQPLAPSQEGGLGLILDIDAYTTRSFEIDDQALATCLAELRWLKNKAFYNLLKKSAIKTFGKVKK